MKIDITEQEANMLASVAQNKAFVNFLKRIIDEHCDIRTLPEGSDKAHELRVREDAIQILDVNLLDRLRVANGEKSSPETGREAE